MYLQKTSSFELSTFVRGWFFIQLADFEQTTKESLPLESVSFLFPRDFLLFGYFHALNLCGCCQNKIRGFSLTESRSQVITMSITIE